MAQLVAGIVLLALGVVDMFGNWGAIEHVTGIALLAVGALLAVANWGCLIQSIVQRKHISMVGPSGGLAPLVGAALLGWRWRMLLALADPGVLSLLYLPVFLLKRRANRQPPLPRASLQTRARRRQR